MSPEVFDDCIPRIKAVGEALGIGVREPNGDFTPQPSPPATWIDIEFATNSAGPIQIGYDAWEEKGQIFIHLMVPVGTGMRDALVQCKALQVAFRGINMTTAEGLSYSDDQSTVSGGDDGTYRPLTLIVIYQFQDRLTAPPPP